MDTKDERFPNEYVFSVEIHYTKICFISPPSYDYMNILLNSIILE